MFGTYYTLRALAAEWSELIVGAAVAEVFSQSPAELSIVLEGDHEPGALRISVDPAFRFVIRMPTAGRARRNVADLFASIVGSSIQRVDVADRDRILRLHFADGRRLDAHLYGSANLFLTDGDSVVEAFQRNRKLAGTDAPVGRPAAMPATEDAFLDLLPLAENRSRIGKRLPLFDRVLVEELVFRATSGETRDADARVIWEHFVEIVDELRRPRPRLYRRDSEEIFSLIALRHIDGSAEDFDSVDEAVRLFARRRLSTIRFEREYVPVRRALSDAVSKLTRTASQTESELSKPSRAETYERWGHTLMASPHLPVPDEAFIEVEDPYGGEERVRIPVVPGASVVENAERYYEKARDTRTRREHARQRAGRQAADLDKLRRLNKALAEVDSLKSLRTFRSTHAEDLRKFGGRRADVGETVPYRRYDLGGGYEVWVGKNARQNESLTFSAARKDDYWFHARGVAGSHTVLRRPSRHQPVPKAVIEVAASIAAFHSKGRGSALLPVAYCERKFVRRPRGAPPGTVVMDRETVVLVEPRLPKEG